MHDPQFDVDIVEYLTLLGALNVRDAPEEVNFSCPFPDHSFGDRNPSAYMNKNTGAWICFSCKRKGNVVSFLAELEGVSILTAKRWIEQKWGGKFYDMDAKQLVERWVKETPLELAPQRVNDALDGATHPYYYCAWWGDLNCHENYVEPVYYMLDRGFTKSVLDEYKIGWDYVSRRITIPYHNKVGELVGFKGRRVNSGYGDRYMPVGQPFKSSLELWEYHTCNPNGGNVILCEGELNALKMRQYGYIESMGMSGSMLSQEQMRLLLNIASSVTLLFDDDEAGRRGNKHATSLLEPYMTVYNVGEHEGDPASMEEEDLARLLSAKTISTINYLPTQ